MASSFNRKRGIIFKMRRGVKVGMYVDQPGVFLASDGTETTPEAAEAVGFNVKGLMREKAKKAAIDEAIARVTREFEAEKDRIEKEHDDADGQSGAGQAPKRERKLAPAPTGPYIAWKGPKRLWEVLDGTGKTVSGGYSTPVDAKAALEQAYPTPAPAPVADPVADVEPEFEPEQPPLS